MTFSAPRRPVVALLGGVLCSACILQEVPDDELVTLPPPCAQGWIESQDGSRCLRPNALVDAGPPDSGFDAGMTIDGGFEPDAGNPNTDCFDPQSGTPTGVAPPSHPVINEYVFTHDKIEAHSNHYYEFFEIYGAPSTDLSDLTFVHVNSHSGRNLGQVEITVPIGTTNLAGFWKSCVGWANETDFFPQASGSLFLVRNFRGFTGNDLDSNDDGVLDDPPWDEIIDQVGFEDGAAETDVFYATPVLTNDGYDGHPISGGRSLAARLHDGADNDLEEDWRKIAFKGYGLPGAAPGSPQGTEAYATPGEPNRVNGE